MTAQPMPSLVVDVRNNTDVLRGFKNSFQFMCCILLSLSSLIGQRRLPIGLFEEVVHG